MHPDLLRYSCQIYLPGFKEASQLRMQRSKVLIVGAGGLGCPAAQYLVAAGVGTIGIADYDTVSVSNLHRQILYNPADVGLLKAEVACKRLQQQNPGIKLVAHTGKITTANVMHVIGDYDIIVDCTDNFETRYLLNDAGVLLNKPVVYGAIYQFEGQVAVWNVLGENGSRSPNYRDLYPSVNAAQIPNCAEGGVIPTLAGIIGCMQANEVIKLITGVGESLAGSVLLFDALSMQSRVIKIGSNTKTNITSLPDTGEVPTITAADLQKALASNQLQLIDVRTASEREAFEIGGLHIPLDELANGVDQLDAHKPLVLYCASGKRSAEGVKVINKIFPGLQAMSLHGGLKAWMELSA